MVKSDDFRMGIANEVVNIRALQQGKQIIICKADTKTNKHIFIVSQSTFSSKYKTSKNGRAFEYKPIVEDVRTRYIATLEYMSIPGQKELFWEKLYTMNEFNLWTIKEGPQKYFEDKTKKTKMYLWFFKVYEMTFEITRDVDFTKPHFMNTKIINDDTLIRIQNGFRNSEFTPVLSDNAYDERKKRIIRVVNEYTNN
ncbi:hypothetical protein EG834_00265 [bacterium]|nr:hypothetical protein [bacterium]